MNTRDLVPTLTTLFSELATGATIAAHVDHLRYGLSLMNRANAPSTIG